MRPVAATGSTRYTQRDMVVGGHYLPKGTMVDVPFYAVSVPWTCYCDRHPSTYARAAYRLHGGSACPNAQPAGSHSIALWPEAATSIVIDAVAAWQSASSSYAVPRSPFTRS